MAGFAKYDGVDGESTDSQHENWIDFLAFEWGVAQPPAAAGQGRRRGGVVVDDLVLTMEYDKAAPKLLESSLRGRIIPMLEIELTTTHGGARATYLKYELTNVLVTSYRVEGSGVDESGPPVVTVANNFEQIKVTYTEFDDAGSSTGSVATKYNRESAVSRTQADAASATSSKKKRKKK